MLRLAVLVAASLVFITPVQTADTPKEKTPASLERLLNGTWEGGLCVGELTFRADGSFERQNYTPGSNSLTGTWELRWNALPPTLVLTCKTSDDLNSFPIGAVSELKVVQLDGEVLAYTESSAGEPARYTRVQTMQEKELAALQGTWVPLQYEVDGQRVQGREYNNLRHIISGDKIVVQVNGETVAEGKVTLDPTQNPKHLNLTFPSGQNHQIIYVRVGDCLTYCGICGNTRPSEFASGTPKGGDYQLAWKIEK